MVLLVNTGFKTTLILNMDIHVLAAVILLIEIRKTEGIRDVVVKLTQLYNFVPLTAAVDYAKISESKLECIMECSLRKPCLAAFYEQSTQNCVVLRVPSNETLDPQSFGHLFVREKACMNADYNYIWELDICVKFSNDKASWDDAQKMCEIDSGHLLVLDTESKNTLFGPYFEIIKQFTGNEDWWIGASDQETEGTFKWVTGDEMTFSSWDGNNPDDTSFGLIPNADCVWITMGGSQWFDIFCGLQNRYLCESKANL